MQEMDMKISNIFKEKKKENNIVTSKQNPKDIFFEEKSNLNNISLLNKKRKKSNSKDKDKNKNLKQNSNIKKINNNSSINNKNIFLGNSININEDEKIYNKNNVFELSARTKNIIEKISAKKNKEKEQEKKRITNYFNLDYFSNNIRTNCNNNKKKSPPKLSSKTMEIIKKINEKRKNRFDRENNHEKTYNSRSSFSTLHLKYDELISEKRELRLPMKYKELLNHFNNLEHILNLNRIRGNNKLNTFENIKLEIESMTHHSFNYKILKQILYVVPHFYILKYIKKSEVRTFKLNDDEINKNYDLIIEIPSDYQKRMEKYYEKDFNFLNINYYKEEDTNFIPCKNSLSISNIEKRKEIFRNILNLMTKTYHDKYLQNNKINIKFNALEQKTWYHKFDPDIECEDIPLFDIPPPPTLSLTFENTITKNDLKKDIMNEDITMNDNTKIENKTDKKTNSNVSNKYVSNNFLNKLRAKERANSVINEIHNYNVYHNSIKDMSNIYREVLIQTKTVLLTNKNTHKLKDVAEMVLNSSQLIKDSLNDTIKVMNTIKKLSNKYNQIINVINHSFLGPVVTLENKDSEIPNKIELE